MAEGQLGISREFWLLRYFVDESIHCTTENGFSHNLLLFWIYPPRILWGLWYASGIGIC